jgi:hypothetical protein
MGFGFFFGVMRLVGILTKITALLAAFLLFQVELIAAKKLLPDFGGGASIWTTCMVFFQFALLLGYGYALWLSSLAVRRQRVIHGLLLVVGGASVVFAWIQCGAPVCGGGLLISRAAHSPVIGILWMLVGSIGLPFFILSSTSSLLQSWWAARSNHVTVNTFTLYSYSNTGSLLGLISYPFLVEPTFSLSNQIIMWSVAFLAYLLAFLAITVKEKDLTRSPFDRLRAGREATKENRFFACFASSREDSLSSSLYFMKWIGLATLPSLMLLAVTTQLTVNVAPIPLLWMLPLAIYLISFMICFSGTWRQRDDLLGVVVLLAVIGCAVARAHETGIGVIGSTVIFCLGLLVVSVFCHGMLYSRRPASGQITRFYFAVSLGGVLGGLIAGVIAPLCFRDYWELPLALAAVLILVMTIWWRSQAAWLRSWRLPLFVIGCVAFLIVKQSSSSSMPDDRAIEWEGHASGPPNVISEKRNFYGVIKVWRETCGPAVHLYIMLHGAISHGYQYDPISLRLRSTAYYAETTGLGILFKAMKASSSEAKRSLQVGGLGMGIGTIAAYGREGDLYRFFEINPAVIAIATNKAPFTYIHDSEAKVEIVEGDARLSLQYEQSLPGAGKYDLLVLDTFSGDSIPVHCLTKEAIELYLSRLKADGVIAAHISNRYLDLVPVFAAIKKHFGLEGTFIVSRGDRKISLDAAWIILTRNKAILEDPGIKAMSRPEMETCKTIRLWTDDYSNLLDVLNWGGKVYSLTPAVKN